jgi:quercetin dioxygenase-like cupin family protein
MDEYRVDFDSVPWQSRMAGVRFKTVVQGNKQLRLVEYTPAMPPHWCEKGHTGCILEGRFEIRFDQRTVVFDAGDGVFIPPGREHRHLARALTTVVRVIFVEDA